MQYLRKRLRAVLGATRIVRFTLLGMLALRFGEGFAKCRKIPLCKDCSPR
jgi:hypothetical protein